MSDFAAMECTHGETTMDGFVAMPEGTGPHAAVLLFPGATGTGPTFEKRARELAALGYLAVGIDVYGKGADLSSPEAAGQHFMALLQQPDELRARVLAWVDALAARPDVDAARMAALGYCFGGKCVFELARGGGDVKAVVGFHGLLETHAPAQAGEVKARVVAWCAGQDPYAPVSISRAFAPDGGGLSDCASVTVLLRRALQLSDPDHDGLQPGIAYDAVADAVLTGREQASVAG
ncbi:MAG: dienelactone hydrolase family protein [Xanthobacteraceae bacterium]